MGDMEMEGRVAERVFATQWRLWRWAAAFGGALAGSPLDARASRQTIKFAVFELEGCNFSLAPSYDKIIDVGLH